MVLNKDIHEFDHLEKKQTVFQKIKDWFVDDESEQERLLQELNYWKLRCSKVEKRYKRLLRSNQNEKERKENRIV